MITMHPTRRVPGRLQTIAFALAALIAVVDQAAKAAARAQLDAPINLTPFLALRLGFNPGVTFGLFAGSGAVGRWAPAILITASAAASAWLRLSPPLLGAARDMATADRLAYALQANLPVFLWLAGCLRVVASIRFRSDADRPGPPMRRPAPGSPYPPPCYRTRLNRPFWR